MSKRSQTGGVLKFGIDVPVKQDTSINLTCTWVKKERTEEILGPAVVLKMTESL